MTNSTKVTVLNGTYTGKIGFYDNSKAARNGRVIVMFTGLNMSGAMIKLTDLVNV